MREHLGWTQDGDGVWFDTSGFCMVEPLAVGRWQWSIVISESYISGPYPGTPDFREYEIGDGEEDTLVDAMWKAQRKLARTLFMDDVYNQELDDQMAEAAAAYAEQEARWNETERAL